MLIKNKSAYQQPNVEGTNHLKMRLQFFNGGEPGAGEGGQGEPVDPSPTPSGSDEPKEPEKTFTQDDVNNLIARETKKQQEKLLKQLGIENFENAKEGMKQFKEWQDAQKTEAERQAEQLKLLEENYNSTATENETLKAQISAMKAGVMANSIEDVVTLAKTLVSDDVDMDAAIVKVVEKYPHFAQNQKQDEGGDEPPKPSFTHGDHGKQKPSETDAWLKAFKN